MLLAKLFVLREQLQVTQGLLGVAKSLSAACAMEQQGQGGRLKVDIPYFGL